MAGKQMLKRHSNKKGFTLLETVIALGILGLASGAIITVFSESLQRIRHSARVIEASALAQSLLDRLEAGEIALTPTGAPAGEADGGFVWKIEAQPYGDAPDRSAWIMQPQTLTINVSWDGRREKDTLALKTLILISKGAE